MEAWRDRNIFLLWDKDERDWPELIAFCIGLWRDLNPGWSVHVVTGPELDRLLLQDYPPEVVRHTPIQALSDMLRVKLLREHGGIWADATCVPIRACDDWVSAHAAHDFNAVRNHSPGRPCCSWFLMARRDCLILQRLEAEIRAYWSRPLMLINSPIPEVTRHLDAHWQDYISDHATRVLRIAPYFWLHYHFAKLIAGDPAFAAAWERVGWFHDGGYGFIHNRLSEAPDDAEAVLRFLRRTPIECNKLNWKRPARYPLDRMRSTILERHGR